MATPVVGSRRTHRLPAKARVWLFAVIVAAVLLLTVGARPAAASRPPTRAEAAAIKKGFLAKRSASSTRILRVRVSTADPRFAAVTYAASLSGLGVVARTAKVYRAPSPVIVKKGSSGKWKPTTTVPAKVSKDLPTRARSEVKITGDVTATLTQGAACASTPGFFAASIYDPMRDIYLSIEFHRYTGPHVYDAMGVLSVASLSVGNRGSAPQWETGQGNNADASSGSLYVDPGRWGIIEAGMARQPDTNFYPQSIVVSGHWDCR